MGGRKGKRGWEPQICKVEGSWEAGKHRFAGLRGRLARKGESSAGEAGTGDGSRRVGGSVGGSVGDWEPRREGKRPQGVK